MHGEFATAASLAAKRHPKFPGETVAYAAAREVLLAEEIELRRHIEAVASQRRALPAGPLIGKSYRFRDDGGEASLLDLFGDKPSLVVYCWMYGPQRDRPCPMCANFLAAVHGNAADIKQKTALKAVARSPLERQKAFAVERGWRDLDFVQAVGDDFARDIGALSETGEEGPALLVFRRDRDGARLFWAAEMSGEMSDPGQDPRGAPDMAPLWNILDVTPQGRDPRWYPKLSY